MSEKTKISEIEQSIKDIFEEEKGKVTSMDAVYELSENEKFFKLVITLHGLSIEDTIIIHTKFIFKTDLEKINIIDNSFLYLYDINCVYHQIKFDSSLDIKKKIQEIIESNNFGENIRILSDFMSSPSTFINHYLRREKATDWSVFDVKYDPKFKTCPCDETTFDFEANINNNYTLNFSIRKENDEENKFKIGFEFMDYKESIETDMLNNIHYLIGSNIAKILNKKLKNIKSEE